MDDDARLRTLLSRFLTENGFRVTTAESAAEARDKLRFMDFDLMVLDVMMPGETGLSLTGDLRGERAPTLPILLLTARGAPEDIVAGFEAGADDYLGKPFDPRVLLARIRAMLRRRPARPAQAGPLQLGTATFDAARAELVGPDSRSVSPARNFRCCRRWPRGRMKFSPAKCWPGAGVDEPSERAIDVQVTRLRRKIEEDPREPRFLHTVRGKGYVLKPGP